MLNISKEPFGSFSFSVIIFSALSCYTLSSFRKSTLDFFLGVLGEATIVSYRRLTNL